MTNSWDNYFDHYSDWDDAHCFNVRLELKFEENLKSLGYVEFVDSEEMFVLEKRISKKAIPRCKTYTKNKGGSTKNLVIILDVFLMVYTHIRCVFKLFNDVHPY